MSIFERPDLRPFFYHFLRVCVKLVLCLASNEECFLGFEVLLFVSWKAGQIIES
jgi:hypothetical protein